MHLVRGTADCGSGVHEVYLASSSAVQSSLISPSTDVPVLAKTVVFYTHARFLCVG